MLILTASVSNDAVPEIPPESEGIRMMKYISTITFTNVRPTSICIHNEVRITPKSRKGDLYYASALASLFNSISNSLYTLTI